MRYTIRPLSLWTEGDIKRLSLACAAAEAALAVVLVRRALAREFRDRPQPGHVVDLKAARRARRQSSPSPRTHADEIGQNLHNLRSRR